MTYEVCHLGTTSMQNPLFSIDSITDPISMVTIRRAGDSSKILTAIVIICIIGQSLLINNLNRRMFSVTLSTAEVLA